MAAKLDWMLAYQFARANGFGDQSGAVLDRIKTEAGADFQEAIDKGYITDQVQGKKTVSNESGTFEVDDRTAENSGVDWGKLPTMGPEGAKLPAGYSWLSVGGRSGYSNVDGGPTYEDPNYGTLALTKTAKPDFTDRNLALMKAGAISMAALPMGAALAGALGGSGAIGSLGAKAATFGIKQAVSMGQGGSFNPMSLISLLKPSGMGLDLSNLSNMISTGTSGG